MIPPDKKPLWNELERSIHEPARLAIITFLCAHQQGVGFQDLKEECGLTDGNLSRHLKVMQEAGLVTTRKVGKGRASRTNVTLTAAGRTAFLRYLHSLEKVLHGAVEALDQDATTTTHLGTLAVS
jgi:DNA-binding transcriptional ArsR family regulator